ncbi:L-aspartate oxidase [Halomonas denitrificans]|nr:L-aspartate oxidase [Halomonas denitrificans]
MSVRAADPPVVVIGAGLAGLWAALNLAPRRVVLLAGGSRHRTSSSSWAQGGIAAALGPDDDPGAHAADTMAAGAGLADPEVVRALTEAAPEEVRRLFDAGVPFERDAGGGWVLSREAAHGRARIARVGGDRAGAEIVAALVAAVGAARERCGGHIDLRRGVRAKGLQIDDQGHCTGVLAIDDRGRAQPIPARAAVLATGGVGGLFEVTTNPTANCGLGLAWAARLGARIRDAEFVQFHPTAMKLGETPAPLATEALRGEGAVLVDRSGRRFMPDLHPDAELAPRDVVARAVHRHDLEGGAWLDARSIGPDFPRRFPTVFEACRRAGLDPREAPIPVAPAAHYHMGGIAATLDGETDVPGLFAIGEVACTGAHGANRLASNSLLETVVMASRLADRLRDADAPSRRANGRDLPGADLPDAALDRLRAAMQRGAGVERDASGLARLVAEIDRLETRHGTSDPLLVARCIAETAAARTESRGAHARSDFPAASERARPSTWRRAGACPRSDRVSLTRSRPISDPTLEPAR